MVKEKLETQADAVVYFIRNLDAEMTGDVLDENLTYQEFPKHIFIQKLGHALDEFASAGDTFLNCYAGICSGETCNKGLTGYSFIGNHSKKYIDLLIEISEGKVLDICECRSFKSIVEGIEKAKRISIDKNLFDIADIL